MKKSNRLILDIRRKLMLQIDGQIYFILDHLIDDAMNKGSARWDNPTYSIPGIIHYEIDHKRYQNEKT